MLDTRLNGLLRRLNPRLAPAPASGQIDRDSLEAFIRHKDESAFAVLVHRHAPMVLRVCQRVLHHAQDAEDACQATFLVLARKADSIGERESIGSWLHGVAFRTALRARRDASRRRARERQAPVPEATEPIDHVAWKDVQILLESEIRRLPERYRSAFVLCHLEGRTREEAAADLGIGANTISSRLARARERLRARLARRGVHLSAVLAAAALTIPDAGRAIPADFLTSTTRAATLFAAKQPVPGVSTLTLQLTNGAMQTMAMAKIKWAIGFLAIGGTLAVGTWGIGQVPTGGPPGAGPAPPAPRVGKSPAVERVADYAQRQRSLKNLKLLMLAMHNFEATYGHFPNDVTDRTGKPLLSWRVELLPYLENDGLYKQFNRNEAWDSEQNLKLLAQMPEVLRVGFEPKGATHTYYQRFTFVGGPGGIAPGSPPGMGGEGGAGVLAPPGALGGLPAAAAGTPGAGPPPGLGGPGAPIGPGAAGAGLGGPGIPGMPDMGEGRVPGQPRLPLRIVEVTDGTSNTLGVIEAGPPVPWTKPADIVYDPSRPLPPLAGPFANVRNASALDGTVHPLRLNLDEWVLRALIEPMDGRVVPALKTLRVRFTADSEEEKEALGRLIGENQSLIATLEKQITENAALLGLTNKLTRDLEKAEEMQDQLRRTIDALKAQNKKLRDESGLRPGAPVPAK